MAFDPIQEDCLRLTLEAMRREHIYPLEDAAFAEQCAEEYRRDPASLIVHDRDRSFHLVALATEAIDYRIPFIGDDAEAERLTSQAEHQLQEALDLEPGNWDAQRMLAALGAASNDEYVTYLIDHRAEVESATEALAADAHDPYSREYAIGLGRLPYLRWLAALASHALIAGKYRLALQAVEDCLAAAPDDPGDVRHTGMLALAKLETPREELARWRRAHATAYLPPIPFRRRHHTTEKTPDAWTLLAVMRTYPHAAEPLYYQAEFPEGVFARVHVLPQSDDELILALSEATPLLQEGIGSPESACLASWIATNPLVTDGLERRAAPSADTDRRRPLGGEL